MSRAPHKLFSCYVFWLIHVRLWCENVLNGVVFVPCQLHPLVLSVKYFISSFHEMLKFVILAILSVPSIRAALSREKMASALIAAEDTETLEDTFKTFEKEQDTYDLSYALADVAKVQAHMPKVVTCLRMAHDPFPKDKMCVSYLCMELCSKYPIILIPSHLQM